MTKRRKVLTAYKEHHWFTYWEAFLECGHWSLASNRVVDGGMVTHAKTVKCEKCEKGVPFDIAALERYNDPKQAHRFS